MDLPGGSYSAALGATTTASDHTHEYVEIDTTFYNDCRHLPSTASVCLSIKRVFGEDEDRRIMNPRRDYAGVFRIETSNIDKYKGIQDLELDNVKIAKVNIKAEKVTISEEGKIRRQQQHDPNDLLVTLRFADTFPLNKIGDEEILAKIIDLNIGSIKRAPQKHFDRKKMEFSGNKFFILKNVSPDDRQKIPEELVFENATFGKLAIGLSHRYQIRFCSFCGKKHDAICKVRQKVDQLKAEREALISQKPLSLRVCGDSTVRYLNENAVQGEVDSMCGGTTGNLLNALDVDDNLEAKETVVFVSGVNEKKSNYSTAEYIYTLKVIRERVVHLLNTSGKKLAIVPPPKLSGFLSAEETTKEEIFQEHLQMLESSGVKIWENPIEAYEEVDGMHEHPSPEQSIQLCKFISQMLQADFSIPLFLKSATEDVFALPNKYWHVNSLYKYGCGACNSRIKNKWFNICDQCKQAAASDEEVQVKLKWFNSRVETLMPHLHDIHEEPSDDEWKCDDCEIVFQELKELRAHYKENHPESDSVSFKRKKSAKQNGVKDDEKKSRRSQVKGFPNKALGKK